MNQSRVLQEENEPMNKVFAGTMICVTSLSAASGQVSATVEHYPGSAPDRVRAAVAAWSQKSGASHESRPMVQRDTPKGQYAGVTEMFAGDRNHVHAFVALGDGDAVCHMIEDARSNNLSETKAALQTCMDQATGGATAKTGGAGSGGATSQTSALRRGKTAADVPASTPTPLHPENWSHVKGVYFQSSYTSGVGVMMVVTYEPLILLDDGTAYEIRKAAVEDLDLQEERQAHPRSWYRWKQNGRAFVLTDYRGKSDDHKLQEGSFFVAHPAEKGGMLNGTYESVGGGGNSALGGEMAIMSSDHMRFMPDGRFTSGRDTAITSSGSQSGVSLGGGSSRRMNGVGTYRLTRYTLETTSPDGRVQRQFFAYSSSGGNAAVDTKMIFIGDSPYTRQ